MWPSYPGGRSPDFRVVGGGVAVKNFGNFFYVFVKKCNQPLPFYFIFATVQSRRSNTCTKSYNPLTSKQNYEIILIMSISITGSTSIAELLDQLSYQDKPRVSLFNADPPGGVVLLQGELTPILLEFLESIELQIMQALTKLSDEQPSIEINFTAEVALDGLRQEGHARQEGN